jgi:hypothetical protein
MTLIKNYSLLKQSPSDSPTRLLQRSAKRTRPLKSNVINHKNSGHMTYRLMIKATIFFIIIAALSSCATISPHENFKDALYGSVGQSLDNKPDYL